MILSIDSSELVKFTNKLEKLHRSALPIAVRETLTETAKAVKVKTMPKTSGMFTHRQPNFFKANSKYERAEGFNIAQMKSTVGFYENKLVHQSTNFAVKDLTQQEHGGIISGKTFIATKQARNGRGNVRENFRLSQINKAKVIKATGRFSKKQNFIRAAFIAAKQGGYVLGNKDTKGSRTLSLINEIWGSTRGQGLRSSRALMIKRTPLYRVKGSRVVAVHRTDFMKRATMEAAITLNRTFIKQAQKQLEKYIK